MHVSVCDRSQCIVPHAYSLFDSETLTHSESLEGREFLRDFGSIFLLFLLALSFNCLWNLQRVASKWMVPVFTQLIGVQVRLACNLTRATTFYSIVLIVQSCPIVQAQVILPNKVSSCLICLDRVPQVFVAWICKRNTAPHNLIDHIHVFFERQIPLHAPSMSLFSCSSSCTHRLDLRSVALFLCSAWNVDEPRRVSVRHKPCAIAQARERIKEIMFTHSRVTRLALALISCIERK